MGVTQRGARSSGLCSNIANFHEIDNIAGVRFESDLSRAFVLDVHDGEEYAAIEFRRRNTCGKSQPMITEVTFARSN